MKLIRVGSLIRIIRSAIIQNFEIFFPSASDQTPSSGSFLVGQSDEVTTRKVVEEIET